MNALDIWTERTRLAALGEIVPGLIQGGNVRPEGLAANVSEQDQNRVTHARPIVDIEHVSREGSLIDAG